MYRTVLVNNPIFTGFILKGLLSVFSLFVGKKEGYFSYFDEGNRFVAPSGIQFIFGVGNDTNAHLSGMIQTDVGYINYLWIGGWNIS